MAKQPRSAPTINRLIDAVVERLLTGDESLIRIPEVCDATGINYGSVYHHFKNREAVIDEAYFRMFSKYVEEEISMISAITNRSTSFEEFVGGLKTAIAVSSNNSSRLESRHLRVRIVAVAQTRPELFMRICAEQSRRTAEIEAYVKENQVRGLVRTDISARQIAAAMQALIFGRTLDDTSNNPSTDEEWAQMTEMMLFSFLAQPPK